MRVLAPWRQRAAVAPGGAAAEEGQPLEVARKSAAAGAVDPGEAAQPLEVARKSGRSGDLIEEAGLVAARPPPPRSRARRALRAARRRPPTIATAAVVVAALASLVPVIWLAALAARGLGAAGAVARVTLEGRDVVVAVDAKPQFLRSTLHEVVVTAADCAVDLRFAGEDFARAGRLSAQPGRAWPLVSARERTRRRVDLRLHRIDFDQLRRLHRPEDLAGARLVCDVRTRTRLWHALPVEVLLRGVRASWRGAGAGAKSATDSAGAAPGADADAGVAAAPETIDATDPIRRVARTLREVVRELARVEPEWREDSAALAYAPPAFAVALPPAVDRVVLAVPAVAVDALLPALNETDAAAAAARVELAAFEVDLRRGALGTACASPRAAACGPLVLRATDDDGRAKRALKHQLLRRELRVRTRMDAATFLGALAGDHALDVATPEARARVLPRGAPRGRRRLRTAAAPGLFERSCPRDAGCQPMIWDDSLDCKLCISAKGAFCAHLEVVDPTANRTKVDWRAVFDTADGNAVLGRLEDAKSARPRFVAVEARGFVGEPGRPALESYLNVSDKGGELLRADFVADGAASGKRASGLTSLTVRVDAKEELDATVSGALDWSGTEEANQTDLQASMTVINKDQERLHMAMTADGDSQDEAMAGSLGLLVRTDADDKLDGHLSGAVDWSGMTDANQTDLWASMTVSNKQRERLHMAMTADGDSQDEAMAGSMGLLVRVDKGGGRRPVSGTADWSGTEDGPTGQHDGQQQAAGTAAHGDDRRRRLAGRGHGWLARARAARRR